MKVLAIYCGRKNGETVKMVRVALKAAKEAGADEVQLVNLNDLSIKPCIDCKACVRRLGDPNFTGTCPLKDDMQWIDEQYLQSDAVIFAAPMYENCVPAPFKNYCDRLGPSHDITFQKFAYDNQVRLGKEPVVDTRFFKARPVLYITHGGSEWNYCAYPTVAIPSISLGVTPVGYLSFPWAKTWMVDGRIEKVREAGKHLVEMAKLPEEKWEYVGDPGICPVCHNRTFFLNDDASETTCALCGIIGNLEVVDGKVKVKFTPEAMALSHIKEGGRQQHMKDLQNNRKVEQGLDMETINKIAKELEAELPVSKPEK